MPSRSLTPGGREQMLPAGWQMMSCGEPCLGRSPCRSLSLPPSARLPTGYRGRSEVQGWDATSRLRCPDAPTAARAGEEVRAGGRPGVLERGATAGATAATAATASGETGLVAGPAVVSLLPAVEGVGHSHLAVVIPSTATCLWDLAAPALASLWAARIFSKSLATVCPNSHVAVPVVPVVDSRAGTARSHRHVAVEDIARSHQQQAQPLNSKQQPCDCAYR